MIYEYPGTTFGHCEATSGHPGCYLSILECPCSIQTAGATSGQPLGGEGGTTVPESFGDTGIFHRDGPAQGNVPSCLGRGFYYPRSCKIRSIYLRKIYLALLKTHTESKHPKHSLATPKMHLQTHNRALLQFLFLPRESRHQEFRDGRVDPVKRPGLTPLAAKSTAKMNPGCDSRSAVASLFSPARSPVGRSPMESSDSHSRPLIAQHVSPESPLGRGWALR